MKNNENVGKCGHAKCAGGNGCYEVGRPMSAYAPSTKYTYQEHLEKHTKRENTYQSDCFYCNS